MGQGYLSPLHPINLPEAARVAANVPQTAAYFAWCYPFASDWNVESDDWATDPDVLFLVVGGYVYFDNKRNVVGINSVLPAASGGLKFGPPKQWRPEWTAQLKRQGDRWRPVTLRKLLVAGATEFCWLRPDEFIAGTSDGGSLAV